jgi:hypothetical protein
MIVREGSEKVKNLLRPERSRAESAETKEFLDGATRVPAPKPGALTFFLFTAVCKPLAC